MYHGVTMWQHQQNRPIVLPIPNPLVVGQYSQSVSPFAYPPGPYAMAQALTTKKITKTTTNKKTKKAKVGGVLKGLHACGARKKRLQKKNSMLYIPSLAQTDTATFRQCIMDVLVLVPWWYGMLIFIGGRGSWR
jgi:hypothetical protein